MQALDVVQANSTATPGTPLFVTSIFLKVVSCTISLISASWKINQLLTVLNMVKKIAYTNLLNPLSSGQGVYSRLQPRNQIRS